MENKESPLSKKSIKLKLAREQYKAQVIELSSAGFIEEQINRLILRSSKNTVHSVINNYLILMQAPYLLTHTQIIRIATHAGGYKNIESVIDTFTELTALKFSPEQIVNIAGHDGGSKNI